MPGRRPALRPPPSSAARPSARAPRPRLRSTTSHEARSAGRVVTLTFLASAPSTFAQSACACSSAFHAEASERASSTTFETTLAQAARPQAIVPLPAIPGRSYVSPPATGGVCITRRSGVESRRGDCADRVGGAAGGALELRRSSSSWLDEVGPDMRVHPGPELPGRWDLPGRGLRRRDGQVRRTTAARLLGSAMRAAGHAGHLRPDRRGGASVEDFTARRSSCAGRRGAERRSADGAPSSTAGAGAGSRQEQHWLTRQSIGVCSSDEAWLLEETD